MKITKYDVKLKLPTVQQGFKSPSTIAIKDTRGWLYQGSLFGWLYTSEKGWIFRMWLLRFSVMGMGLPLIIVLGSLFATLDPPYVWEHVNTPGMRGTIFFWWMACALFSIPITGPCPCSDCRREREE